MSRTQACADPALAVVADVAAGLHSSGSVTSATLDAVESLSAQVGMAVRATPTWEGLTLTHPDGRPLLIRDARPATVHMARVAALRQVVADRLPAAALRGEVNRALGLAPSPTWLFVLAAGLAATCLALIFGSGHPISWLLVFTAAATGALIRRQMSSRFGAVPQVFVAGMIAGLVGGLSMAMGWTSQARLVAVCPAMVLVPGPQILNGCLDVASHRVSLGLARLGDAGLTLMGISAGLLTGLFLSDGSLPVAAATRPVSSWVDVLAAGLAAACYAVFFSMPRRMLGWTVLTGMAGHGVHWFTSVMWEWHLAVAALASCLTVSVLITLLSRHHLVPFASVGFAAVVALVPGVYLFRAAAGLVDLGHGAEAAILLSTVQDGVTALLITGAMTVGLVLPQLLARGEHRRE